MINRMGFFKVLSRDDPRLAIGKGINDAGHVWKWGWDNVPRMILLITGDEGLDGDEFRE